MNTLYIGLEKGKDGNALEPSCVRATVTVIKREAARIFGGYSASTVSGGWTNPEGELVEETALRLEVSSKSDPRDLKSFALAAWAGNLLNQSCVLLIGDDTGETFVPSSHLVKISTVNP